MNDTIIGPRPAWLDRTPGYGIAGHGAQEPEDNLSRVGYGMDR